MQHEKEKTTDCEDNKLKENEVRSNGENKDLPLKWLADVALQDKNDSDSDSDSDQEGNHSTLRELLIRPSHKPNGSNSSPNSPESCGPNANDSTTNSGTINNSTANNQSNVKSGKKSKMDTLNEVISSVIEDSVQVIFYFLNKNKKKIPFNFFKKQTRQ